MQTHIGLTTEEHRTDYHLISDEGDMESEVMAEQGKSPR